MKEEILAVSADEIDKFKKHIEQIDNTSYSDIKEARKKSLFLSMTMIEGDRDGNWYFRTGCANDMARMKSFEIGTTIIKEWGEFLDDNKVVLVDSPISDLYQNTPHWGE